MHFKTLAAACRSFTTWLAAACDAEGGRSSGLFSRAAFPEFEFAAAGAAAPAAGVAAPATGSAVTASDAAFLFRWYSFRASCRVFGLCFGIWVDLCARAAPEAVRYVISLLKGRKNTVISFLRTRFANQAPSDCRKWATSPPYQTGPSSTDQRLCDSILLRAQLVENAFIIICGAVLATICWNGVEPRW
jgi:hypothetical protein